MLISLHQWFNGLVFVGNTFTRNQRFSMIFPLDMKFSIDFSRIFHDFSRIFHDFSMTPRCHGLQGQGFVLAIALMLKAFDLRTFRGNTGPNQK